MSDQDRRRAATSMPDKLAHVVQRDAEGKFALDQLVERKYDEWKSLARKIRWRDARASLTATALLDEAYIRLSTNPGGIDGKDSREVLAIIANVMWEILVDQARRRRSLKRGSANQIVPLEKAGDPLGRVDALPREDVLTLKFARDQLKLENSRAAEILDLRFSLGLTTDETAEALSLSKTTIERESRAAREFLLAKLRPAKS